MPTAAPKANDKAAESARPPKDKRINVDENGDELVLLRVTETQHQRDTGTSIVDDLTSERKGWRIPEDPQLLQKSANGNSFNLVMPKKELERRQQANNRRARLSEGFPDVGPDGVTIKERTLDESTFKGSEVIPAEGNNG